MVIRFDEKRVGKENEQFFVDMLSYVSPKIQDVKRNGEDIILDINEADKEFIEEKVESLYKMIESGSISGKEVPITTLEDHTDEVPVNKENIYEKLCEDGDVVEWSIFDKSE